MTALRVVGRALKWLVYLPPARKTTFRERLLPWPMYAALGSVLLVLLPFFLAGQLDDSPERSRLFGYMLLPGIAIALLFTGLSWRYRRHDK